MLCTVLPEKTLKYVLCMAYFVCTAQLLTGVAALFFFQMQDVIFFVVDCLKNGSILRNKQVTKMDVQKLIQVGYSRLDTSCGNFQSQPLLLIYSKLCMAIFVPVAGSFIIVVVD